MKVERKKLRRWLDVDEEFLLVLEQLQPEEKDNVTAWTALRELVRQARAEKLEALREEAGE